MISKNINIFLKEIVYETKIYYDRMVVGFTTICAISAYHH